jgi:hypothetical protein
VGGWEGQKLLSRPSADSFAVGRRQKGEEGEVIDTNEKSVYTHCNGLQCLKLVLV